VRRCGQQSGQRAAASAYRPYGQVLAVFAGRSRLRLAGAAELSARFPKVGSQYEPTATAGSLRRVPLVQESHGDPPHLM
jgi:hypothetical protein